MGCRLIVLGLMALAAQQQWPARHAMAQTPAQLEEARRWFGQRGPVILQAIETWKRSGEPDAAAMVTKFQQEYEQLRNAAQISKSTTPPPPVKCDRNDPATFYECEFFDFGKGRPR
jgi:hypothetical protein